jgi:hypothetical protein
MSKKDNTLDPVKELWTQLQNSFPKLKKTAKIKIDNSINDFTNGGYRLPILEPILDRCKDSFCELMDMCLKAVEAAQKARQQEKNIYRCLGDLANSMYANKTKEEQIQQNYRVIFVQIAPDLQDFLGMVHANRYDLADEQLLEIKNTLSRSLRAVAPVPFRAHSSSKVTDMATIHQLIRMEEQLLSPGEIDFQLLILHLVGVLLPAAPCKQSADTLQQELENAGIFCLYYSDFPKNALEPVGQFIECHPDSYETPGLFCKDPRQVSSYKLLGSCHGKVPRRD